jgi:HPr kinase/phosphorylase
MSITVRKLLQYPQLDFQVDAGESGLGRIITTAELNRPSMELTGYFAAFRSDRIQIFGNGEVSYIHAHEHDPALRGRLDRILSHGVPCAIVTNGSRAPRLIHEIADAVSIPVLTCPHSTTKLYKRLWENLETEFAPATTVHGVLIDMHDMGVLIQGRSSVGKSECGLELIRRGFQLVADDMVVVKCLNDSVLMGRGNELLPFHMEARGLGIIDISRLFGVTAIRETKRISLVITLDEWHPETEYDRTGLVEDTMTILEVEIPHVTIPVRPGRNVGTLVEIAALNQKLKAMGVHTAQLMSERLLTEMGKGAPED